MALVIGRYYTWLHLNNFPIQHVKPVVSGQIVNSARINGCRDITAVLSQSQGCQSSDPSLWLACVLTASMPFWTILQSVGTEQKIHENTKMHSVGCVPPTHWPRSWQGVGDVRGMCSKGHAWQGVHAPCHARPPVDRILDTRLWKHYLPATIAAGVKIQKSRNKQ